MAVRGMVKREVVQSRSNIVFAAVAGCYLLLMGRFVWLQGVHGAEIQRSAIQEREEKTTLYARRGSIFDRNGGLLAVSLYAGRVGYDPGYILEARGDAEKTAKLRAKCLKKLDEIASVLRLPAERVREQVAAADVRFDAALAKQEVEIRLHPKEKPKTVLPRCIPIRCLPEDAKRLNGMRSFGGVATVNLDVAQQLHDVRAPGFGAQEASRRSYAAAENAAHIVGYVASEDGPGTCGLEAGCQRLLAGHNGSVVFQVDRGLREIPDTARSSRPAQDGLNIVTTLDATAQQIATEEAERVMAQFHPKGVSVVIIDPTNGDIMAMVSAPNYDPNPERRELYLTREALANASDNLTAERCASRLYEPGSTLKALTLAGALDAGVITTSERFYCSGHLAIGKKVIHCVLHGASERYGHGSQTPEDILRHSCNIGAAIIGMKMKPELLYKYDRLFGLTDRLDIGLPTKARGRFSFGGNENIYTEAKAARVAFGHSIAVTPLHVAMAYGALANGGLLMKPRLIQELKTADGRVVEKREPKVVRRVLKKETADMVCGMLRAVVANGTGKVAAIPGYMIAGKTGTAQKYGKNKHVASFIGILPASPKARPRAVILVAVDEPQGAMHYGAEVAAPAFQSIARRLMNYWRVPEDDPTATQAREAAYNLKRTGHAVTLAVKREAATAD